MVRKMLAEMHPFRKIVRVDRAKLLVKLRSLAAECNPFVKSCVSIARNCGKISDLVLLSANLS